MVRPLDSVPRLSGDFAASREKKMSGMEEGGRLLSRRYGAIADPGDQCSG